MGLLDFIFGRRKITAEEADRAIDYGTYLVSLNTYAERLEVDRDKSAGNKAMVFMLFAIDCIRMKAKLPEFDRNTDIIAAAAINMMLFEEVRYHGTRYYGPAYKKHASKQTMVNMQEIMVAKLFGFERGNPNNDPFASKLMVCSIAS